MTDAADTNGGNTTSKSKKKNTTSQTSFKGESTEMKGHVFQLPHESGNLQQFAKTLEQLKSYVSERFQNPTDVLPIFKEPHDMPKILEPPKPENSSDSFEQKKCWSLLFEDYLASHKQLQGNMARLASLIWGQCSKSMKERIKSLEGYDAALENHNCSWFIRKVKELSYRFEERRYVFASMLDAKKKLCTLQQPPGQKVQDYYAVFVNMINAIEYFGGVFGDEPALLKYCLREIDPEATIDTISDDIMLEVKKRARQRYLALTFIQNSDKTRYAELLRELANGYVQGRNEYPSTLASAQKLLVEYQPPTKGKKSGNQPKGTNSSEEPEPTSTPDPSEAHSFTQIVHATEPVESLEHAISLAQVSKSLNKTDILLDSQSNINVVHWSDLVSDIKRSAIGVRAHTNGGYQDSNLQGKCRLFAKLDNVWYNPDSIANIYSLAKVSEKYRVTMDTDVDNAMFVHMNDRVLRFQKTAYGLYKLDLSNDQITALLHNHSNAGITNYSFLHSPGTVEHNEAKYSPRDVSKAKNAIELIRSLGYIDPKELIRLLNTGGAILNCTVTADDVRRAVDIYGTHPALLKGKSVRRKPAHVPKLATIPVPDHVRLHYNDVTLCVDYFFVNQIPFFHTISRDIKLRSTLPVTVPVTSTFSFTAIQAVINIYQRQGFRVTEIHGDNEFEALSTTGLLPAQLRIAAAGAKVPEAERSIRTIRDRVRCFTSDLPFKRFTKEMIMGIVREATRSLNQLPLRNGVSSLLSPVSIICGHPPVDASRLTIRPGMYAQVLEHGATDVNHKSKPRTVGAIALYQADPVTNSWYFQSLATWRRVHVAFNHWTILPTPSNVIQAVEERASVEGQPIIQNNCPFFQFNRNDPLLHDDDDVDEDEHLSDTDDEDSDDEVDTNPTDASVTRDEDEHDAHIPFDMDDPVPLNAPPDTNGEHADEHNIAEERELVTHNNEERAPVDNVIESDDDASSIESNATDRLNAECESDDSVTTADQERSADVTDVEDANSRSLRPSRERNYDHLSYPGENHHGFTFTMFGTTVSTTKDDSFNVKHLQQLYNRVLDTCKLSSITKAPQGATKDMIAAKAIKVWGDEAVDAIYKEFAQIHDQKALKPIDPRTLTKDQEKKRVLREITLVKRKRSGKMKARTVADGRPQREYVPKEQSSSPTVSSGAFLMTCLVDALERRDIAIGDVVGAYLNAKMKDFVIMKITNKHHIDILCKINPIYKAYVVYENGKPVLYVQLLKALYGCVQSALLWYELFANTLQKLGFELNPVDPCVANMDINGSQCTICWYVDDNKISHKDPDVVTDIIHKIEEKFGKMQVTRGKRHTFLGMDLNFETENEVRVIMKSYLEEAINSFDEEVKRTSPTPARKDLFEIDPNSPRLQKEEAEMFHSVVALLLYVAVRARVDILLTVAFLCTRVSKCTQQDKAKLRRLLEYLKGTLDLEYILSADSLKELFIWIDAAFAVHEDMKGHTGGAMSMGKGTFMVKSSKQKQNTLSSTECEHSGVADYLPSAIWMIQFLKYQGINLEKKHLFQDNESTIKLLKNGRLSAGQNSRHIDIRLFFSKDRIKNEKISVQHCPTEQMLADFYSKPLQGSKFREMRDWAMGHKHISTSFKSPMLTSEERVGDKDKISHVSIGDVKKRTYAEVTRGDATSSE